MRTAPAPVIDVAPFFAGSDAERTAVAGAVASACEDVGFLLLTGHGVPEDAIDDLHAAATEFFAMPLDTKRAVRSPVDNLYQGYAHPGPAKGDHTSERQSYNVQRFDTVAEAIAAGYPDDVADHLYEALWPDEPAAFRPAVRRYMAEMEAFSERIMRIIEHALGLDDGRLAGFVDQNLSNQAVNYYSDDIESGHEPSPYRFKAHRDGSMFTILYQDDGPGSLQLYRRGEGWLDVTAIEGTFVVNTGEILERYTNGRWPATPHRVLQPPPDAPRVPRISAPYFVKPNLDAPIEPLAELLGDEPPAFEPHTGRTWSQRNIRNIDDGYDSTRQFEELVAADPSLA
jgi:isopenicillin N synthase-like dioxygenase